MNKQENISLTVLFTGYSGAGKSFFANALKKQLFIKNINAYHLDGDEFRKDISKDLGFSLTDRSENIRRAAEVCKLLNNAGVMVLASFIAPLRQHRLLIKKTVETHKYLEIFVNTSLKTCKKRDVKQLYKRAEKGEIKNMTGIDAPYEKPINPDFIISENNTTDSIVLEILNIITEKMNY